MNEHTITLNPGPSKYELWLREVGALLDADLRQGSNFTWRLYREGCNAADAAPQVAHHDIGPDADYP